MTFRKPIASLVFALALAAGAGCISIEEDIEVRPDDTVQYGVDFRMMEMVVQSLSGMSGEEGKSLGAQWLAAADSAARDSTRLREFVEGADHHFVAERDFASLDHLAGRSARNEATPESLRSAKSGPDLPLGGIRATRLDGGRIRLVRRLENPTPASPPPPGSTITVEDDSSSTTMDASDAMAKTMFADRVYVFRLRAPRIESANGTIAADQKSAEWRIPMSVLAGDTTVVVEAVIAGSASSAKSAKSASGKKTR